MKKNLLSITLLSIAFSLNAQVGDVLTHVDNTALFYVGQDALVYNGGGMQTKGTGVLDVHGNVMVVGGANDVVKTITNTGANRVDGGNIILRLNDDTNYMASTYGQLYINGVAQGKISATVNKEIKENNHGTYHQIALPFYGKKLNTLNAELGKTFSTTRWSQNEILKWNNRNVKSDHFTNLNTLVGSTANEPAWRYYMIGLKSLNLASAVKSIKGVPVANGVTASMADAGLDVSFGPTGNYKNSYNEFYYSYLQDVFEAANPWTGTYGRNMYQFGNPYLTNLDLSKIGVAGAGNDGTVTGDGNILSNIVGIRYNPGSVATNDVGGTTSTGLLYTAFANGVPAGDVGMLVKPLGTFVIKFSTNTSQVLNFDGLRRFNYTTRAANKDYSVTAARMASKENQSTVKQLGVIGLDANGKELARTYYVVYSNAKTGHPTTFSTQVANTSSNLLGTYEENPDLGGYDSNYATKYWLYINEANEQDFLGKAIPMVLYSPNIKSLKFEVRENAELVKDGTHQLSSGIGFYYQSKDGRINEVSQNDVVSVENTEYNLFYGNLPSIAKGTKSESVAAPSRTKVTFDPSIDNYIVQFDPNWKNANIKVYDMSGKIVLSEDNVNTDSVFVIELSKEVKSTYVVSIISDKGEKLNTKILR